MKKILPHRINKRRNLFITFSALLLTSSCNQLDPASFSAPELSDDGWEVSDAEKAGFDSEALGQLFAGIPAGNPKLNGIVIARHGKLVAEQYYNGYNAEKLCKIWSVTKAVTGSVLGIAIDKGLLSEKDSIYKYLDYYLPLIPDSAKSVTIEHLITMTSGYKWTEMGGPRSAGFRLAYSPDWIEFILNQPHVNAPGSAFNYSSGNTLLLAPIIHKTTGMQAVDFAKVNFFDPLGITRYQWDLQSEFWTKTQGGELPGARQPGNIDYKKPFADYTNTASGLHMLPRDICKIGQLYLNKGRWNGKLIVSEEWIDKSIQSHFGNRAYGYHWRLMNFEGHPCYYATGFGFQRIFVFPAHDLVIVLTMDHYKTMHKAKKWTAQFLPELLKSIRE